VPPLDLVLDSDRWLFAVLSRAEMYRAFLPTGVAQKTAGLARLRQLTQFVTGSALPRSVQSTPVTDEEGVQPRAMTVTYAKKLGPPVETVIAVQPEAVADDPPS
jgi:hypothetical protein